MRQLPFTGEPLRTANGRPYERGAYFGCTL